LAATLADGAGLGAALGVFAANGVDAEIAELAVEEAVIGAAAEFAVGRELQPDALLQRQRLLDRGVLGGGERLAADFARANLPRWSSRTFGRSKLPMCSARNGGLSWDSNASSCET
jgi:hypothetical protein